MASTLKILVTGLLLSSQTHQFPSSSFAGVLIDEMPDRGICAHRGASATHPENTLASLQEAVRLGAHMIEFDLALTKDSQLVLLHDETVDRTTNGHGRIADLTLANVRALDAGSWKSSQFENERIPTFGEAMNCLPLNVWINVHLKGGQELAAQAARQVVEAKRLHQCLLACGTAAATAARAVEPSILICNMDRQLTNEQYVSVTLEQGADFIQLLAMRAVEPGQIKSLQQEGVRINFCCTDQAKTLRRLFSQGVEFVLVDQLDEMLQVAEGVGIERLQPVFRSNVPH